MYIQIIDQILGLRGPLAVPALEPTHPVWVMAGLGLHFYFVGRSIDGTMTT